VRGPELNSPVEVVQNGALSREAIGWSRIPIQSVDLRSVGTRHKRWEHWAFLNEELLFMVTLADAGPFSFVVVAECDLATRAWRERARPVRRLELPSRVHGADIHAGPVSILTHGDHTTLRVEGVAELEIERRGDTLNVVVPMGHRFAFTSKQVGFRARGTIRGRPVKGFATLDHGRGTWPWRTKWNWACAADAHLAFNLGARWTDDSGTNENGFFVNGTLYPIAEDMRFLFDRKRPDVPVGIVGGDVDLLFTPIARKRARVELGVLGADLDFRVGRFMGRIGGHSVQNILGWCEAFDARW
jgi:hypothetical protein